MIARGYSDRVSMVEVIGLVFSFVPCLLFIPNLGGLGAALGSFFGYVAAFIAGSIVLLGINLRKGNRN